MSEPIDNRAEYHAWVETALRREHSDLPTYNLRRRLISVRQTKCFAHKMSGSENATEMWTFPAAEDPSSFSSLLARVVTKQA